MCIQILNTNQKDKKGVSQKLRPQTLKTQPSGFFSKKISIVNSSQFLLPDMFYGHVMFIGNSQKEARLLYRSNSEKLTRFKIAADILMAFAGEFFTEKIEDTELL